MKLTQSLYLIALAVFGLIFGSFANVVVWRLPRRESLAHPGSHCPACSAPIAWYDNVPILSWFLLRGRCRKCGGSISFRYPLVEAASGALWVLAGVTFGMTPRSALAVVFFYLLLVLAVIDLDVMRLPNPLVALLALAGAAGAVLSQATTLSAGPLVGIASSGWMREPVVSAIVGAALGAGFSGLLALGYGSVRGRAGMGMGDVKLLGAMGLFLGPYVLLASFFGSVLGIGGSLLLRGPREDGDGEPRRIPFGPFLALGGVIAAVAGPAFWNWYASLAGIGGP